MNARLIPRAPEFARADILNKSLRSSRAEVAMQTHVREPVESINTAAGTTLSSAVQQVVWRSP